MSRAFALAVLLLGFVCVGVLASAEAQEDAEATETFQFWGDDAFPLSEPSYAVDSLSQPASAAEQFDGDADDVFFDNKKGDEQLEYEKDQMGMPCDMMQVSDEEALSMEGDLERLRFTIAEEEPVFIVTSRPMARGPVIATPFGALMQSLAIDPLQEWMDRQMRVAQEMELLPSILRIIKEDEADYGRDGARYYNYEQEEEGPVEEEEEPVSLQSLSRLRLGPAMSDLMAGSEQRKASQSQSGFTEDGARWTSSQGVSNDGSSQWYSFSMSYGNENKQQQMPQKMMSSPGVTESQEDDADYEQQVEEENEYYNDGEKDWSAWMETWNKGTLFEAAHKKKSHVRCAIIAGLIAGPFVALIGFFLYRARAVRVADAAPEGTISSVQEPLLAPVSPSDHAEPYLVVAADHADLEKHYVNIKYVPLNGE